jgi:hypothetical protein
VAPLTVAQAAGAEATTNATAAAGVTATNAAPASPK